MKSELYGSYAEALYDVYKNSGAYAIQRIKSIFYGKLVVDQIPTFLKLYDYLVDNGHDIHNKLWLGDDDNALWYEEPPDEYTKILVDSRVVSCADDYTHVFVYTDYDTKIEGENDSSFMPTNNWVKFRCFTAFPEEKTAPGVRQWGDHRDIEDPSIETHREWDWKFGYGDARDKFYSFSYDSIHGDVNDAYAVENRILLALDTLRDDWLEIEENYIGDK